MPGYRQRTIKIRKKMKTIWNRWDPQKPQRQPGNSPPGWRTPASKYRTTTCFAIVLLLTRPSALCNSRAAQRDRALFHRRVPCRLTACCSRKLASLHQPIAQCSTFNFCLARIPTEHGLSVDSPDNAVSVSSSAIFCAFAAF